MKTALGLVLHMFLALGTCCSSFAHTVEARVLDEKTHLGIAGATVTCGDEVVQSDERGDFHVDGRGEKVMLRAPGYRAAQYRTAQLSSGTIVLLEPFTPRALYLSAYGIGSKPLRESALGMARRGLVNALVIDLKGDRGLIPYPSVVSLAGAVGARQMTTIADLGALVKSLHAEDIYLIARIVVFKDNPLASARRDLAVARPDGSVYRDLQGLAWTDPFNQEVRSYNLAIAVEAAQAGFDEIQFDYVRFPDISDQLRFAEPANASSRSRAIEQFLREARERLVPYNVYLAVDIFGYVCWNMNDTGIGQVLEGIVPLVDYVSPMLYPSSFKFGIPGIRDSVAHPYDIVYQTLRRAQQRTRSTAVKFRPWIQAFRDYAFDHRPFEAREIEEQARAARTFGSDGYMLWNPRNQYGTAFWSAP